ncbi:MAG: hypothetical protein M1835_001532 [Candelina submexicana]|nr:MAG: hypothetical protein M1835_001532 [Candelina submexicana]
MKAYRFVCAMLMHLSVILAQLDFQDSDMKISCGGPWNHGDLPGDPTYKDCEPILSMLADTEKLTESSPNEYSGSPYKNFKYFVLAISKTCQLTRRVYGATDAGPATYNAWDLFFLGNFVFYQCVSGTLNNDGTVSNDRLAGACVNSQLLTQSNWLCFDNQADVPNAIAEGLPGFDMNAATQSAKTNYPPDGSENDGDIEPRAPSIRYISNAAFANVVGGLLGILTSTKYFGRKTTDVQMPFARTGNVQLPAAALSQMLVAMQNHLSSDHQGSTYGTTGNIAWYVAFSPVIRDLAPFQDISDYNRVCNLALNLLLQSATVNGQYYILGPNWAVNLYQSPVTIGVNLGGVQNGADMLSKLFGYVGNNAPMIGNFVFHFRPVPG